MVNVGIIGAGQWGLNYVRVFSELEGSTVTLVCDPKPDRLGLIAKRWPWVRITTEAAEVVGSPAVDAVVVAAPASSHFELAAGALDHGKHVLVEKPLATRLDHARRLAHLSEGCGRTFMVGHVFCYNPGIRVVGRLIREAALGEIRHLHFARTNLGPVRDDVDALWDLAPHDVSILLHLLGEAPTTVSANGGAFLRPGVADVAFVVLRFRSGTVASLHVSWIDPRKVRQVTVVGSSKMALFDDLDTTQPVKVFESGADSGLPYSTFGEFRSVSHSGDVIAPRVQVAEPLKEQCRHFLACVGSGEPPITGARQGLAVCAVLDAASRSLRMNGHPVEVEI